VLLKFKFWPQTSNFDKLRDICVSIARGWDCVNPAPSGWAEPQAPAISVPCLGCHGRWGNSILQYMFLTALAAEFDLRLETPDWIGRHLFDLADPIASDRYRTFLIDGLSQIYESSNWPLRPIGWRHERGAYIAHTGRPVFKLTSADQGNEDHRLPFTGAEIEGLFLVHTGIFASYRELILSTLRPIDRLERPMREATAKLRSMGKTVIGVHIRRGDFTTSKLAQSFELVTSVAVYRRWLEAIWPQLADPVLFLCSDDPNIIQEFSDYQPVSFSSLEIDVSEVLPTPSLSATQVQKSADFFPDWILLTECDILAISNSTFSFSAALLNKRAHLFFRPLFDSDELSQFDPWNSEPLLFVKSHPLLPWEIFTRLTRASEEARWTSAAKISLKAYMRVIHGRLRCVLLEENGPHSIVSLLNPRLYLDTYFPIE
jgi:hypothetical protein